MDNTILTLVKLIKILKIRINIDTVQQELIEHPNYPSLLSISDFLTEYGVKNMSYYSTVSDLGNLEIPYIAHLVSNDFVLVKESRNGMFSILDKDGKDKKIAIEEFSKEFSGAILIAEPSSASGDPQYLKNKIKFIYNKLHLPTTIFFSSIILSYLLLRNSPFFNNLTLQNEMLVGYKLLGLFFSVLLLIQSIDYSNPFIGKFCIGTITSCNSILSSKAAKVLGGTISLSEIGFFYFLGTLLVFLLNSNSGRVVQFLSIMNVMCLPFTFYSIYYQGVVAKQWCTLCCSIQILLWLEFTQLYRYVLRPLDSDINNNYSLINLLLCFILPILLWSILKPYLIKLQEIKKIKEDLKAFKANEYLFETLLKNQTRYRLLNEDDSFIIGNPQSSNIVTIITNLHCGPCAKTHSKLEEWMSKGFIDFKLQIIFLAIKNNQESEVVVRHMIDLTTNKEKTVGIHALNYWYSLDKKNYNILIERFPVGDFGKTTEKFDKQQEWCNLIEIEVTPTILINGYKLPKPYQVDDIKYFI
ncbi:vitamin K epoxide reductase family protein [Mucilaginibacter paludis]|uniref:Peptidase C39 bacteriocin processing n=1 Tax=Mucilaginibacter paludis DSM 18603 TaxID=714943 RepID=H1YDA7_9SPHI|nr:vitamin K epoxide reductase family protein [Mucilaginibacter paludis]EHQ27133.1 peptidase C39 bacteriocin processing [Mucilaginibacter paludis DSM 18603]